MVVFENEIEKEEAVIFKTYLRLAIANFAAADSSSTPPKTPSHTRPMKISRHDMGKDKIAMKKVAIATPPRLLSGIANGGNIKEALTFPKIPHIGDKTWAMVARHGQKKARVILSFRSHIATVNKTSIHQACKEKSSMITSLDKRIYVYLPQEHE